MNPLERAVIAAARRFQDASSDAELIGAVLALEAWEATQDPEVQEIGWHELAEGDLLKSVKNGRFYPVLSTLKTTGGYRVTIQAGEKPATVVRPSPGEPTAFVKRGATGASVDMFVNVFSSGEGH